MGRLYKPMSCWSYARGLVHEYPVLKLRLLNLLGESIELELPIDTGFEGAVMLDYDTYSSFTVGELPREAWRMYRTLAGPLPVRTARAIAEVDSRQFEVFVETPVYGGGKRLLGREPLNRLTIVLDGHARTACTAEAA
ncbi:MAG: hypothetical protein QXO02_09720 [Thermofilaceae archaeon]